MERDNATKPLNWITWLLSLGAVVALAPMWGPVLLAAWFAIFTRHPHRVLTKKLGGRSALAAGLTVGALFMALVPAGFVLVSAVAKGIQLATQLAQSANGRALLEGVVKDAGGGASAGIPTDFDTARILELVKEHGARAWGAVRAVAGAGAVAVLGLFLFVIGVYSFLVNGDELYAWLLDHSPLRREHTRRLLRAFAETGRGLFVGMGLTALCQGAIAGVTYVILGIPSAFVLSALTAMSALIPSVGTFLVWGPIAAGLALTGQTGKAIILVAVGTGVIGAADNVLRPIVSRWGSLQMPTFLLMLAIFGGLAVFGAGGLLLGPLAVRLALEALSIARGEGLLGGEPAREPPGDGDGSL